MNKTYMKLLLRTIFALTLLYAHSAVSLAEITRNLTIKELMNILHEHYCVNFIYDSSLELDIECEAKIDPYRQSLEESLTTIFYETDIKWEIRKKYILLTRGDKKAKDYKIFIEEQTDTLSESRITAYIKRNHATTQTGLTSIDGQRFNNGYAVLGSPDLIKEIQHLPGVSGGTELLSGMYVHGGDGTDNLFLLDGVPLYQVTHVAGLVSSFNTEIIDNIDFYKSGFPARYGGKLSSVVDITTRTGDFKEFHGSFNIGLLSGGLQYEGPIVPGKTSFNVAVRRSWFDTFTIPYNAIINMNEPYGDSKKLNYSMTDLNASITHLFNPDSRLSLNFFASNDCLVNRRNDLMVKYWEGVRHTGESGYKMDINWGNLLTSLNWYKKFSDDLHLNTSLYYVVYNSGIDINNKDWKMNDNDASINEDHKIDENTSKMHDMGAKIELDWIPSEYHHIVAGSSYSWKIFNSRREFSRITSFNNIETYSDNCSYNVKYKASETSIYTSDEITLANWFKANIGLKYTYFAQNAYSHHSIEPRAALRFQLCQSAALKMSYTEMSQSIHLVRANYLDIPTSVWLPSTKNVTPMKSRQAAAGVYLDLPHNISLNIEGYWKFMRDIYEYSGKNSQFPDLSDWERQLFSGLGRSYGAEIEAEWRTKKMDISAYYTLSWTERFFEGIFHDWYPARNDNRHKLTLSATRKFSDKFEMYAGWHYHTGDRATIPTQIIGYNVFYESPYNYQMSDYHRLDIGFNFHRTTKRGNKSTWNLTIYNAYCRMNPMFASFYYYIPEGGSEYKKELVETCVIPIIPSFNYTLRF